MGSFYYDAAKITANMTLKEKIGQIAQIQAGYKCYDKTPVGIKFTESFCSTVREYGGIGAISGLLRSDPWTRRGYGSGIEIEEREHCALSLQNYLKENTRLGIPALIEVEASHGLQSLGSVMYPTGIGCAGSFDVELYEKMMTAIGREIRMSGNHIGFMTVIDLARDPRWGRSEECLGEDPFLASLFAGACIRGIKKGGALACAKHFCAAGAGVGGRNQADISIGDFPKRSNDGRFDESLYLKGKGVRYVVYPSQIEKVGQRFHLRNSVLSYVENHCDQRLQGLYLYLLLGSKTDQIDDLNQMASSLAILHVFAISGMHFSLMTKYVVEILSHFISE